MRTTSPTGALDAVRNTSDAERIARALAESGLALCPGFLSPTELRGLTAECRRALCRGALSAAHVGRGAARAVRSEIRGDSIGWLRPTGATPAVRALFERMEALRVEINRRTYLGLFDFECHFSVYPPGARYRRHLDRFHDGGARVVSCVLYLNEAWAKEDGGCLRIYNASAESSQASPPPAARPGAGRDHLDVTAVGAGADHLDEAPVDASGDYLDVAPAGGTLVAFASADYEHEVLAAKRERMSVAGWFRTAR